MGDDEKQDYTETVARLASIIGVGVALSYLVFAWRYALSIPPLEAMWFWVWNILIVSMLLVLCVVVWGR